MRSVVLECPDPRASAEFYRQVLGWAYRPGHEQTDPAGDDWLQLVDPDGGPMLALVLVEPYEPPTWPTGPQPQRVHLDVQVTDLDAEHERVLALGARLLHDHAEHPQDRFRVYADLAGHPFCLVDPAAQPAD